MKTFEVVLMGASRLVRVNNFESNRENPRDFEMRPMSIRALFIPAEHANRASGIASRLKRSDERITSVRLV